MSGPSYNSAGGYIQEIITACPANIAVGGSGIRVRVGARALSLSSLTLVSVATATTAGSVLSINRKIGDAASVTLAKVTIPVMAEDEVRTLLHKPEYAGGPDLGLMEFPPGSICEIVVSTAGGTGTVTIVPEIYLVPQLGGDYNAQNGLVRVSGKVRSWGAFEAP